MSSNDASISTVFLPDGAWESWPAAVNFSAIHDELKTENNCPSSRIQYDNASIDEII